MYIINSWQYTRKKTLFFEYAPTKYVNIEVWDNGQRIKRFVSIVLSSNDIHFILDRRNRCSSRSPWYLLFNDKNSWTEMFSPSFSALLLSVLLKRVHATIMHRLNLTRFLTQLHHHFDIHLSLNCTCPSVNTIHTHSIFLAVIGNRPFNI